MLRIKKAFANKAKIAYLTAGDGGIEKSVEYFLALVKGGATLLEIGIPYSDPVADGEVIQEAMVRALKFGTTLETSLEIARRIRAKTDVAIIIFTYYNIIQANLAQALEQIKSSGADGILVVDLPYEEGREYRLICKRLELSPIPLIAPTTSSRRLMRILADVDSGFVYYICQKGTTGTRDNLPEDLALKIAEIRKTTTLPIAVGFGVSTPTMVKEILKIADGCIVGSYIVKQVANNIPPSQLTLLFRELYNVT
jgi:tryptophan synthase alpha chain